MTKKQKQLSFEKVGGWGGKRTGAGRKNLTGQVNHMARPEVSAKFPLNITLKLRKRLPSLRNKTLLKEFKKAVNQAKSFGLRVNHFSIQDDHVHIVGEANNKNALSSGMQSLGIKLGKAIRKHVGGLGSVFKGRYHVRVLKTPTEVKNAIEYVLVNKSKHMKVIEDLDNYSSGVAFKEWPTLLGRRFKALIREGVEYLNATNLKDDLSEVIEPPRSWLGSHGWKKACG